MLVSSFFVLAVASLAVGAPINGPPVPSPDGHRAIPPPSIVIGSRTLFGATPDIRPPPYPPTASSAPPPTIEPIEPKLDERYAEGNDNSGPYEPPTHPETLPPSLPARSPDIFGGEHGPDIPPSTGPTIPIPTEPTDPDDPAPLPPPEIEFHDNWV